MRKITVTFKSGGKTVRKTAIVSNDLKKLSSSARNEAYDMDSECWDDGYWNIWFEGEPGTLYEVQLVYDRENYQKTLLPKQATTWVDDVVDDAQLIDKIKVTYL